VKGTGFEEWAKSYLKSEFSLPETATISKMFQKLSTLAISPPVGDEIFLRLNYFSASTIAQEVFHKFNIFDSALLQEKWGLNPKGNTEQFNKYFKEKCLKKRKNK
jgi:hypothetical protein